MLYYPVRVVFRYAPAELIGLAPTVDGKLLSADTGGVFRLWELEQGSLESSLDLWRQMIGDGLGGKTTLAVTVENTAGRKELERYSGTMLSRLFLDHFSAPRHAARCALRVTLADRVLTCACNPMVCPIYVFRPRQHRAQARQGGPQERAPRRGQHLGRRDRRPGHRRAGR